MADKAHYVKLPISRSGMKLSESRKQAIFRPIWHRIELEKRGVEIIEHHLHRYASILAIVKDIPRRVEEIVPAYFEPNLWKGFGFILAEGEAKSHLELLRHGGDVMWNGKNRVTATGASHFEQTILDINPEGGWSRTVRWP